MRAFIKKLIQTSDWVQKVLVIGKYGINSCEDHKLGSFKFLSADERWERLKEKDHIVQIRKALR